MSNSAKPDFIFRLKHIASVTDDFMDRVLSEKLLEGEIVRPPHLLAAMRHGVLNGGKRLRPFLTIESAALFGLPEKNALQTAAAIEVLHCYSLIHDDLPAMDDDDLRRGQPTVHKAFDEAAAILAGDALLTLAFDLLSNPLTHEDANIRIKLVSGLARATGIGGMVGGQALDLAAETQNFTLEEIMRMQAMKTGALIKFSCEAGAILAGADQEDCKRLAQFGEKIGQAFQLADDILDVTATKEQMGKKTGKDSERGKATFVAVRGMEAAKKRATQLVAEAELLLALFGKKAASLKSCARYIIERKN